MKYAWTALAILSMGCGSDEEEEVEADPIADILALSGDSAAGDAIYASNCSSCHAADGTGDFGPDLTASLPDTATWTDEAIVERIFDGGNGMTAFGDSLTGQEIADVTEYIIGTFGG